MALTDKQQAFVDAYLMCWNATKAARIAGYSEASIRSIASENLTKPNIRAEIEARLEQYAMGANEVLARLTQQARGDIGDFADIETGQQLKDHPQSYLVRKFKRRRYQPENGDAYEDIELELYDAYKPTVDIGKHHGLFDQGAGEPQEVINYTPEQWAKERENRLAKAQATAAAFEDAGNG